MNQVEEDDPKAADIILIGPPTGGVDTDLEDDDENEDVSESGLPKEVCGELEIHQYTAEDENSNDNVDLEDSPPKKKCKKGKKGKICPVEEDSHISKTKFFR